MTPTASRLRVATSACLPVVVQRQLRVVYDLLRMT